MVIGRIYETRGGPDTSALVLVADRQPSDGALGPVATLEEAKARFQFSKKTWEGTWEGLAEFPVEIG